jgi:hypothetical protein
MLPFSAVLWQLGRPVGLSAGSYRLHCHDVVADLRASGVFAPIFIAQATENSQANRKPAVGENPGVQPALVDPASGLFNGPDLDPIDHPASTQRTRDAAQIEVDRAAGLWLDVLAEHWPLLGRPGD